MIDDSTILKLANLAACFFIGYFLAKIGFLLYLLVR